MLITLQSSSDVDANDFTNFFKETVQIQPHSEIALVNVSYKYDNSIVISSGSNDGYSIELSGENLPISVSAGSHAPADLVTALNSSLSSTLTTADYRIQQSYASGSQVWSFDSTSNKFKITLQYGLTTWDKSLVESNASITRQSITYATGMMDTQANNGIIRKANVQGWPNDIFSSGYTDLTCLWCSAQDVSATPHGSFRWKVGQNTKTYFVGMGDGNRPSNFTATASGADSPIAGLRFSGSNFKIEEIIINILTPITGNIAFNKYDEFEIRADQTTPTDTHSFRYFKNTTELTAFTGSRFPLRPTLKCVPCGAFYTAITNNALVSGAVVNGVINPAQITISNAGTSYKVNEIVEASLGTGTEASF